MGSEIALTVLVYVVVAYCAFRLGEMRSMRRFGQFFAFMVAHQIEDLVELHDAFWEDVEEESR